MATVEEEKGHAHIQENYTQDGTVDLKGRPILRSKTGGWKACSFIVGTVLRIYIYTCILHTHIYITCV